MTGLIERRLFSFLKNEEEEGMRLLLDQGSYIYLYSSASVSERKYYFYNEPKGELLTKFYRDLTLRENVADSTINSLLFDYETIRGTCTDKIAADYANDRYCGIKFTITNSYISIVQKTNEHFSSPYYWYYHVLVYDLC